MAGGSGTRFWPLSRQLFPKQLLRIMGDETLIQQTMRRVVCASAPHRVMISTNPVHAESIRVQLSEWTDALSENFVLEPEGRNNAPAIALVALGFSTNRLTGWPLSTPCFPSVTFRLGLM